MNLDLNAVADASVVLPTAQSADTQTAAASGNPSPQGAATAAPAAAAAAARPATIQELKAACEGAPSEFLVAQLEAGATVSQAQTAFVKHLQAENARLAKQAAEKPAAAQAQASGKKPGAQPVPAAVAAAGDADASDSGDAVEAFNEAVAAEMKRTGKSQAQAHATVCRKQPELREAMVAAHNAKHATARRHDGRR